MRAAGLFFVDATRALIEAGANINLQNDWGKSALMYSMGGGYESRGRMEIIEMFFQNGAKINVMNKGGTTAYDLTTDQESKDLIDKYKNIRISNQIKKVEDLRVDRLTYFSWIPKDLNDLIKDIFNTNFE